MASTVVVDGVATVAATEEVIGVAQATAPTVDVDGTHDAPSKLILSF